MNEHDERSVRAKGEEALGDLAQAVLDNPVLSEAISRALGAGERAAQAQRNAMSAVGVPSAADVERLERRVRSLSDRLEELEDRLDEVADDLRQLVAARERESAPGGRG